MTTLWLEISLSPWYVSFLLILYSEFFMSIIVAIDVQRNAWNERIGDRDISPGPRGG